MLFLTNENREEYIRFESDDDIFQAHDAILGSLPPDAQGFIDAIGARSSDEEKRLASEYRSALWVARVLHRAATLKKDGSPEWERYADVPAEDSQIIIKAINAVKLEPALFPTVELVDARVTGSGDNSDRSERPVTGSSAQQLAFAVVKSS